MAGFDGIESVEFKDVSSDGAGDDPSSRTSLGARFQKSEADIVSMKVRFAVNLGFTLIVRGGPIVSLNRASRSWKGRIRRL